MNKKTFSVTILPSRVEKGMELEPFTPPSFVPYIICRAAGDN